VLAKLLLTDPVANANLLPKLLALEAVPSDDVRSFLKLKNVGRRRQMFPTAICCFRRRPPLASL
jgi:hypothetical protein